MSFEEFQNHYKKSFAVMCFLLNTCFTSKSKNLIHINQQIIKTFEKFAAKRLNCVIKIFASISMMNRISYNQKRTFFNVFKRSQHSYLIAS